MKADGCSVQMEGGFSHASDPPGPGGVSPFWKTEPGVETKIRLILPDNVSVCVDNTGLEEWFDEGVEYIFESRANGMISVHDRTGVLRECFESRFEVRSSNDLFSFKKHFKMWGTT
jgi:hypothetical protein